MAWALNFCDQSSSDITLLRLCEKIIGSIYLRVRVTIPGTHGRCLTICVCVQKIDTFFLGKPRETSLKFRGSLKHFNSMARGKNYVFHLIIILGKSQTPVFDNLGHSEHNSSDIMYLLSLGDIKL
jgi:hypothetical protein